MKGHRGGWGQRRAGRWRLAAAALASAIASSASAADLLPDALSLAAGDFASVTSFTVGGLWKTPVAWPMLADNNIDLRIAGEVAYWYGHDRGAPVSDLWDFGLTPLLHWSPREGPWRALFVEGGIGLHLLTHAQINDHRRFSTAFQFGERLVVGVSLGGMLEVGGYLQHVSNAKIKKPNDGLTQFGVMLRLPLR